MRLRLVGGMLAAGGLLLSATGCSGSSPPSASGGTAAPGSTVSSRTGAAAATTSRPMRYAASITGEHEVNGGYRQGLARGESGAGWVFSTNDGLHRTDDAFTDATGANTKANPAIPDHLKQQGYNHIGDIDIAGGNLWAPIEKEDKDAGEQVMAIYDPATFQFRQSFVVKQHHNSFVAVDAENIVYSTDQFSDDAIVRYRFNGSALEKIESLNMSQKVDNIQGGDIADGAIWLSTDDDHDGLHRVDLTTGAVQDLGSMGHADGEGEGIDAQPAPGRVTLEVLSVDAKLLPVRVIDVTVRPSPS